MADDRIPRQRYTCNAMRIDVSADQLRSLVHYNPQTGIFIWQSRVAVDQWAAAWNKKWSGKRAGCLAPSGYWRIGVNDRSYYAHRLAWLYVTGEWPPHLIDHINNERHDNRFSNLRLATHAQNLHNSVIAGNNSGGDSVSGYRGVYLHRASGMYHATISHNDRTISLGYFHEADHADVAYRTAERLLRGKWIARDRGRGKTPPSIDFD